MKVGSAGRVIGALLVLVAVAGLTGCDRQVSGPSLVLRLATPDRETDPTGLQVSHFADEVRQLSGGAIRIEPVWDVTPNGAHDWDQTVARGVADGDWDMGLVPGRAWDVLGVTSLRALNTPFLVTSEAALEEVLDSDLRDRLLAGLPDAGVVGLDLFPDELRHPFGQDPLLGAEDYAGQSIRAATSETVTQLFAALGATTTDNDPDGSQRGVESEYSLTPAPVATGNVTFFPKTEALVVRSAVRDRLRADQWQLLQDAAGATREWLFAQVPTDQQRAADYCAGGGEIVEATAAQLASLTAATAPVVHALREDTGTRDLIDSIKELTKGVTGPPAPTSCPGAASSSGIDPELATLNGTYLTRVTAKQLHDAGVDDPVQVAENTGRFVWVLDDGTWTYFQQSGHFIDKTTDSGSYTYRGGLFTVAWLPAPNEWTSAQLDIGPDGTIHFEHVLDGRPENQRVSEGFFQPWHRLGGVSG
jgi:TRAP-type C4-dicarboxylate transport system substrate-binding protein